jgi:hypothetical protein
VLSDSGLPGQLDLFVDEVAGVRKRGCSSPVRRTTLRSHLGLAVPDRPGAGVSGPFILSAFTMSTASHGTGMWRYPDTARRHARPRYWTDLAGCSTRRIRPLVHRGRGGRLDVFGGDASAALARGCRHRSPIHYSPYRRWPL